MRWAARVDSNHAPIVEAFRAHGFSVLDVSRLKKCCDLFVAKMGICYAIEIKDGAKALSKQQLTEGEQTFREGWKGPYSIVTTVADVAAINREILFDKQPA